MYGVNGGGDVDKNAVTVGAVHTHTHSILR